jgi:uncharacterized protein (TIGR00106 family)
VLDVIDASGVDYRLHPMGTILEGEWSDLLDVVTRCFEALRPDCERISVSIRIDYRRGGTGRLDSKIASVEKRLGRKLRH